MAATSEVVHQSAGSDALLPRGTAQVQRLECGEYAQHADGASLIWLRPSARCFSRVSDARFSKPSSVIRVLATIEGFQPTQRAGDVQRPVADACASHIQSLRLRQPLMAFRPRSVISSA